VQERIDTARLAPPCPRREHKLFGKPGDLALLTVAASRLFDQTRDKLVFVREQRFANASTAR
jgi:hypothetical protein